MKILSQRLVSYLTLFSSVGTLICCAIPALLVSLGAGATLASVITNVPQLALFSEYKLILFVGSGLLILLSGIWSYKVRNAPCPIDPEQAKACTSMRRLNKVLYLISAGIWSVGFFFAYVAVHIL